MALAMSSKLTSRSIAASRRPTVCVRATQGSDYVRTLPGVSQPFPNVFDPFNLAAGATVKDIRRWRESELIHGRVAMLAALGFIVQENVKDIPNFTPFGVHIQGPAIYHFQQIRQGFWEPLLIAIGLAESYRVTIGWATPTAENFNYLKDESEYNLGDLGFDPLGLKPTDPEGLKEMQTKELNNGRLAMIAIAGFVGQELLFQREFLEFGNPPTDVTPGDLPQGGMKVGEPGVPGGPPSPPVKMPANVPTK